MIVDVKFEPSDGDAAHNEDAGEHEARGAQRGKKRRHQEDDSDEGQQKFDGGGGGNPVNIKRELAAESDLDGAGFYSMAMLGDGGGEGDGFGGHGQQVPVPIKNIECRFRNTSVDNSTRWLLITVAGQ
jgi:hypothetical protein